MKIQRNDLCPCGSKKKYKKCCGQAKSEALSTSVKQQQGEMKSSAVHSAGAMLAAEINQLINLLNTTRQFDVVETRARDLTAKYPSEGMGWKILGVCLGMQRRDALEALQKAAQFLPHDAEVHNNLGDALRNAGQLDAAVKSCRRALKINPAFAEAHNNLGIALRRLGQLDEAQISFRRALEIKPNLAQAHSNLGNVLLDLDQYDEAVVSFRRAVEIKPNLAEAYCNMSKALLRLGQPEAAIENCRQALQIQPHYAEAHNNLGNALLILDEHDEAAASYRRAIEIAPDLVPAYRNLAIALKNLGFAQEAEISCRQALAIKPDYVEAMATLAGLYADQGRFADTEELFKRAISISSDMTEAWFGISQLRKMTSDDAAWLADAQRVAEQDLPPQKAAQLQFAIAKYFDDVKDFQQAFVHYKCANEFSKLCTLGHDRQQMTRSVDSTIQTYDRNRLSSMRAAANESERPVFIVGMPRSGTTLAEQILASHPAVFGAGELNYWLKAAATGSPLNYEEDAYEKILNDLAENYLRLLEARSAEALRVIDKMPNNFQVLGLINSAFPNARIIHMQRNPIDTCLSIYFQNFSTSHSYANDLENLAHYYREYRRLMEHWRATLPAGTLLEVSYEELVEEQEIWSHRMIEFIGLPWDPRCLDFHQASRTVSTSSKWQVRQKISKSSVARWRNYEQFIEPLLRLQNS